MEIPVSGRVRFMQAADQVVGAFAAFHFGHGGQGLNPFLGFLRVHIQRQYV
ncbi:hypothetical protein D3C72_1995430 [compost metagenome]